MTSTSGEPIFTTAAAQALLEESEAAGRGTPLVPEMYFGGEGSNVSAHLFAPSGPLSKPPSESNAPKFVFRNPFVPSGRASAASPMISRERSASDVR